MTTKTISYPTLQDIPSPPLLPELKITPTLMIQLEQPSRAYLTGVYTDEDGDVIRYLRYELLQRGETYRPTGKGRASCVTNPYKINQQLEPSRSICYQVFKAIKKHPEVKSQAELYKAWVILYNIAKEGEQAVGAVLDKVQEIAQQLDDNFRIEKEKYDALVNS